MNRAMFMVLAALSVVWASFLTLDQPLNAPVTDGLAASTALSSIRMSEDAKVLAGLVLLVCSKSGAFAL